MRKMYSEIIPKYGISALELGTYRYIKANLDSNNILRGGMDSLKEALGYPYINNVLLSLKRKGLLNYGFFHTDEGKALIVELKEIA